MWQVLAELLGPPHAGGVGEGGARGEDVHTEYSLDFVAAEEIVWDLDPFKLSDTFRICCVLRMFDQALRMLSALCVYATHTLPHTLRIRSLIYAIRAVYTLRIRSPILYVYAH